VLLQVLPDQGLQRLMVVRGQRAPAHEDLAQGPVLLQDPGVHRGDQGVARDEVHPQRQDAEQ
jgi:hypothetical protein